MKHYQLIHIVLYNHPDLKLYHLSKKTEIKVKIKM